MALRDYLAGEVAQDCADGRIGRREALRRLGLMGVTAGSASALLVACGGGDDVTGDEARVATAPVEGSTTAPAAAAPITFGGLQAAWAEAADPAGAVLLVHENRGLTPHFFEVAARFARDGYSSLSVDLLSFEGGTASLTDPAAAPAALAARDVSDVLADLRAGLDELERRAPGAGLATVGFCFGGGMVWNLLDAGEPRLAAAVPFYGPAPAEPDFAGSDAAVLAIYAGLDDRVNATRPVAEAALQAAGLTYEIRTFDGADHAFFNDTGDRYDEEAATEAYALVLDWFAQYVS